MEDPRHLPLFLCCPVQQQANLEGEVLLTVIGAKQVRADYLFVIGSPIDIDSNFGIGFLILTADANHDIMLLGYCGDLRRRGVRDRYGRDSRLVRPGYRQRNPLSNIPLWMKSWGG